MKVTLVSGRNRQATGVDRYQDAIARALRAEGAVLDEVAIQRKEWRILGKPVGGFASVWAQRAFARTHGESVVHALEPSVAARGTDVVTVHDLLPEMFPQWFLRTAGDKLNWRLARRFASRASRIIAVSQATADVLVERWNVPRERVAVIHHGIDATAFHPEEAGHSLLEWNGPVFVYVGDDNPRKNLKLAVEALGELAKDGVAPRLVRCGPTRFPDLRDAYHATARALGVDVVEAGFLPDAQLRALLSGADAFLWPTLGEGFGFPPLEAMACGCPVVASDIAVNREILGPLAQYHANDPASVAEAMRRVLRAPPAAAPLVAHARSFSWDRAANRTLAVYREVARA